MGYTISFSQVTSEEERKEKHKPKKQLSIEVLHGQGNLAQHITDDFVASVLQAGIAVNKWVFFLCLFFSSPNRLAHPAIRGVIRKYTTVHGSIARGATLYRAVDRVYSKHIASIRKIVSNKRVWVATDEWTDSQVKKKINPFYITIVAGSCNHQPLHWQWSTILGRCYLHSSMQG